MHKYITFIIISTTSLLASNNSLFDYNQIQSTVSSQERSKNAIGELLKMESNNEKILIQLPTDLSNWNKLNQLKLLEHEKHIFSLSQTKQLLKIKSEMVVLP